MHENNRSAGTVGEELLDTVETLTRADHHNEIPRAQHVGWCWRGNDGAVTHNCNNRTAGAGAGLGVAERTIEVRGVSRQRDLFRVESGCLIRQACPPTQHDPRPENVGERRSPVITERNLCSAGVFVVVVNDADAAIPVALRYNTHPMPALGNEVVAHANAREINFCDSNTHISNHTLFAGCAPRDAPGRGLPISWELSAG